MKKKITLLFAVILSLLGSSTAWADDLNVYNDADYSSDYVPFDGYNADAAQQNQMIFPSTVLTALEGKQITSMTFYYKKNETSGSNVGNWIVSLGETSATTLSALDTTTPLTEVFSGAITPNTDAKTITITFETPYVYNGGNLLVEFNHPTASGYKKFTFWCAYISPAPAFTRGTTRTYLPKTTFAYEDASSTDGPVLAVKDGSTKVTSPYAYNFGLATAGVTKTFTLSNPGTADLSVSVSETGNFGATLSASTIAAGGEVTLTLTMPETTGNSEVTITPDATGIDPFIINVSGTVRDANKVYEYGFTALPEEWTTTGSWYYSAANGAYTTVWYLSSNARLITPKLTISEGESIFVEAKGYSTSNTSYQHLQMQYSADGTTWTNFDSEPTLDPSNWNTFAFTGVPAGNYYIAINASQADVRMFYGGELPQVAKMVVTQPASLDYGVITEATTKTFTIANTGRAELKGISVASSNSSIFAVTGAPTSLAAGENAEVTITMAATTTGALNSTITVSATDMESIQFTVSGIVLPEGLMVEDFEDGLPEKWNNVSNYWTFNEGMATARSSYSQLITPKLAFSTGDMVAIKAQCTDSDTSDYLQIYGSNDNGSTWTAYDKKIYGGSGLALMKDGWGTIVLTDIPATVNHLKFVGYYVNIDEIAGLNYAPVLDVYKNGQGVAETSYHDFGECGTDVSVTYNFSNYGGGTISITNVAITGKGAAAYSTNWTESVAVPFDLVISRSYNAERVGASDAVVTVTTTEGTYIINVTGTDLTANAPALAVTFEGEPVTTGFVADFGTQLQEAPKAQVYTITNSGTGTLTGTITNSSEKTFSVSASEFSLGAGESMSFEIALVFDEYYGTKAATITIHPTNEGLEDIVINATASTLDPEAWTEDFAAGSLPTGWVATTWTVGTFSSYENKTTMALAPGSSTAGTLVTPCLTAKEGEVLTWDAYFNWYDEAMIVEYSADEQASWTKIYDAYKAQEDFGSTRYTHKEMSFTAPADGNYYLRFTSTYQNGVDNFCGFKLNLPDHIMAITASSIPTSGSYSPTMKATKSFNATVTVKESRGVKEENVVAKVYMGEEVIGTSEAVTVEAGETKQITITATPTVAATEGAQMHIEVEWAGETLKTAAETRYVAEFVILALTETEGQEISTNYSAVYDVVTLTRSFVERWNTFVAPVATNLSEFGEDAVAYTFSDYANGVLSFSKVTKATLDPATPYVIYVSEAIASKTFTWDAPVIYSSYVGEDNIKTIQNGATFQGTYAPIGAGKWNASGVVYGLTSEAKIAKANTEKASINGFRAYFVLPAGAEVKALRFDGLETGVRTISADEVDGQLFDINGRKVSKTQHGIYVVNGKKVIVK